MTSDHLGEAICRPASDDYITVADLTNKMSFHSTSFCSASRLQAGTIQREWDHTLHRLRALGEVVAHSAYVDARRTAYVDLRIAPALDIAAVEQVVFENLLLAPLHRRQRDGLYTITAEWLWHWRRPVPWRACAVSPVIRLYPDSPVAMWTYRYELEEAEG